jgi:molybdopterin-containing oxidoreductase family iron-sulfur binding subunit
VACPYGVNYFNWKAPEKNSYLEWDDPDLIPITNGKLPYANPDLKEEYGDEKRRIAGGGHIKGVMEKCTFCVHRLENGLNPACVDVCPTKVIVFGDLDDPNSNVSQAINGKAAFRLLEDVGTNPSVYYLGGQAPTSETRQIEEVRARV